MEFVYVAIGVVIGVVGVLVLGVDKFSNKVAEEEEKIDDHEAHNEGK